MEIIQAIILGIVQGLTEFLPISSSAHLLVLPYLFGWPHQGLAFDVALHAGTTLAIVGFFARDLWRVGRAFLPAHRAESGTEPLRRTGWAILLSCLPAGVLGLLFQDQIETVFRSPVYAGINLIVFGVLLYLADHHFQGTRTIGEMGLRDALWIGVLQALALVPGVSRSGITITAGLARRFQRAEAARFSFLMITPIVVGATGLKFLDLYQELSRQGQFAAFLDHGLWIFLAGMAASFAAGFGCIGFLLRFLRKFSFDAFALYRLLFGTLVLYFAFALEI